MAYRLVALDLDGTAFPRRRPVRLGEPVSQRVRQAIRKAQDMGIHIVIATGRMFRSALPYAQELSITTPLICYQGALIKDPVSFQVLHHQGVPLTVAREVIAAAREWGLSVNIYLDDGIYVDELSPSSPIYQSLVAVEARAVGNLLEFLKQEPTHLAVVSEEARSKELVLRLQEMLGDRAYVSSGHPLLAEVSHPQVSKGKALALVARHLGVLREEVISVGDDWNDIDMLRYAGLGVAMAGSPAELLAVADVVAPPASEDGLAAVLERYL